MGSEENLDNEEPSSDDAIDAEQEAAQLASEAEAAAADEGAGKRTLGVERWVQIGFIGVALLLVWLTGNIVSTVWYIWADPDESLVSLASVVGGVAGAMFLYRNATAHAFALEISEELAKVSWPTRKETSSSTIVVVVTSIICAIMLFLFDTIWSSVTDLVYKV
jgi:preprotein translocase subunit SecE